MARHSKKKKKRKSKDEESEFNFSLGISQETKNGIFGILAIGLAVLAVLALIGRAGDAGNFVSEIITKLFGWGVFLVPLALLLLGVSFLKSIHREVHKGAIVGTVLFMLAFLAMFYIIGGSELEMPARILQGGYLGVALGYPLLKFVGFTASFIIIILILLVSILVVLDISVDSLIMRSRKDEEDDESEDYDEEDDEEYEDEDEDVVIKRGSQVIDANEARGTDNSKPAVKADAEKDFVIKSSKSDKWILPPISLLHSDSEQPRPGDINANVAIIKRTLSNFGINVEMGEVSIGPAVTQFTLRPAVGVKLSRITALSKDLALALAASSIRIEAPIPGKALVGIEIPNAKSAVVGLRDILEANEFKKSKYALPIAVGRDVAGYPIVTALEKMPHLLIAGSTGSGKSVTINSILLSLLYRHSPESLKLILVDPKRVELSLYNHIPHLITPVIVDTKKVIHALKWAIREMEKRYEKLSEEGSRDIFSYNAKRSKEKEEIMPVIVIVIDELADLMASHGRDVEASIVRLAQMARAVGIHLIVSTQRPSVEVITGLIKANISTRVALRVASQVDSRTILDMAGAEKLLGNGDMLYLSGSIDSRLLRLQGVLVTEEEVKDVISFIRKQADDLFDGEETENEDDLRAGLGSAVLGGMMGDGDEDVDDDMFHDAKKVVIETQKASASFLQRRLRVGYARAARLLDLLEERGIIGPGEGAKPRDVYVREDGTMEAPDEEFKEEYKEEEDNDSRLDDKIAVEE
ncbi:MAG: DNA translocase FtsK 4TM domain-containing protein [Parcubacteria group bacterium]